MGSKRLNLYQLFRIEIIGVSSYSLCDLHILINLSSSSYVLIVFFQPNARPCLHHHPMLRTDYFFIYKIVVFVPLTEVCEWRDTDNKLNISFPRRFHSFGCLCACAFLNSDSVCLMLRLVDDALIYFWIISSKLFAEPIGYETRFNRNELLRFMDCANDGVVSVIAPRLSIELNIAKQQMARENRELRSLFSSFDACVSVMRAYANERVTWTWYLPLVLSTLSSYTLHLVRLNWATTIHRIVNEIVLSTFSILQNHKWTICAARPTNEIINIYERKPNRSSLCLDALNDWTMLWIVVKSWSSFRSRYINLLVSHWNTTLVSVTFASSFDLAWLDYVVTQFSLFFIHCSNRSSHIGTSCSVSFVELSRIDFKLNHFGHFYRLVVMAGWIRFCVCV